ncbi:sulfite exporter TauE/SafE family protein [Corynebacterium uterequi]|uniref:Probable membrane transporter protein n=1 Tax=Corynebacterium uterequi TaxID=1072256 RepID=A0A0G3HKS9_9CORY|nr:sulfite exporter TauE/SafE family protein [Corynebacterium uterequi]AKK11702.1 putative permease [Corynebacterium uterequi]
MDLLSSGVLFLMGILAGMINAAVGSGSLLTLPVLLALGVPPGTAVRTNTIGMTFASIGSAVGFRTEVAKELPYLGPLVTTTVLASAAGSLLLLVSPSSTLDVVIPVLIVVALVLVLGQPRLSRWLAAKHATEASGIVGPAYRKPPLVVAMSAAAVYGGYFTAAQGILYMAIMGVGTNRSYKDVNPVKVFLAMFVNLTATLVYLIAHFCFDADVRWAATAIIAVGGLIGGYAGAFVAKRLPAGVFRVLIVVVALVALVKQLL